VFRFIAGLSLVSAASIAAAATTSSSTLNATAPWWERVTVTINGDGEAHSCRFESSLKPNEEQGCDVTSPSSSAPSKLGNSGSKAEFTRLTFERRFTPGPQSEPQLPVGDTLLGQQVMALAIGSKGTVEGCEVVAASGDVRPDYGCAEAKAEKFQASAHTGPTATKQAYMTIIVYGHSEHVV
jgi:hypothetical protein